MRRFTPTIRVTPRQETGGGWYATARFPFCHGIHRHTLGTGAAPDGGYRECHEADPDRVSEGYILVPTGGTR